MAQTDQTFARLNTDDSDILRPTSDFTAGQNLALEPGAVQAQRGNVLVPYSVPPVISNTRIGGFEDGSTGAAISLLYNGGGLHRIIRYDPTGNNGAGSETTLLQWSGLNLSPTMALQGGILDGLLIYLDADGAVRSVNLKRATDGGYTPELLLADPYALHLVKQPPVLTPLVSRAYLTTGTANNQIVLSSWQFAFQYGYADGEVTPVGPYSAVLPRPNIDNTSSGQGTDPRNYVLVTLPPAGSLPSPLVTRLRVLVRKDDDASWSVAADLRRANASAAFPATYSFYGVMTGGALTVAESTKSSEALSLKVGALALARSRTFVGDCTEGYAQASPLLRVIVQPSPAYTYTPLPVVAGLPTVTAYQLEYDYFIDTIDDRGDPRQDAATRYQTYVLVTGTFPDPASTYQAVDFSNGIVYAKVDSPPQTYTIVFATPISQGGPNRYTTSSVTSGLSLNISVITPVLFDRPSTLHMGSLYTAGIAFFDRFGRGCGACSLTALRVPSTPLPGRQAAWTLSSDPIVQQAEIPEWAYSYSLLLSRNQTTSFFLQFYALYSVYFGTKPDGSYDLRSKNDVFSKQLWVSLDSLTFGGTGYIFEKGDMLRFYDLPGQPTASIIGQYGQYIALSLAIASRIPFTNSITSNLANVEIFRPLTQTSDSILYTRSIAYPINRQGVDGGQRTYSVSTGILDGDCFFDGLYDTMTSNPSATSWLDASRGRPVPYILGGSKQVRRKNLIRFSGVKVQGTMLNGLSQWEALNQYEEVPQEQGAITRLTVADQAQTDGSIMLVNQERGDLSLSLGQSQIRTADDQPLLAITKSVIGGGNALRGGYGCTDPASVVAYAGKVFFWCARRTELLRYDRNGLTPLGATHKARTLLGDTAIAYAGARVTACYNPHIDRKELYLTFQAIGTLPGVTLVYSDLYEAWSGTLTCLPDAGMALGSELLTFSAGNLWRHTVDAPVATFYGQLSPVTVTFITSQPGGRMTKIWRRIAVNSIGRWLPTRLSNADNQRSRILPTWFKYSGGIWRAAIRRDENTPGQPSPMVSLHEGASLQSAALKVTLTADPSSAQPLTAASLEFILAQGQGHSS